MTVRGLRRLASALAGTAAALSLVAATGAALASASLGRNRIGSFGFHEYVLNATFDNSSGPSSGDVYLATLGDEIYKFTASGSADGLISGEETPQKEFAIFGEGADAGTHLLQIAVASSGPNSGDLYVTSPGYGLIDEFSENGKYLCQITGGGEPSLSECDPMGESGLGESMTPSGVAVGANGDVYVSNAAHGVIDVFGAKGEYITRYDDPDPEPGAIAINAAGDLYVSNGSEFEPTGVLELATEKGGAVVPDGELESLGTPVVAVDRATGEVLAPPYHEYEFGAIDDFEGSGTKLATFGEGVFGVAIDEASDEVYAKGIYDAPEVVIYGPLALTPTEATTDAPGEVGEEAATLHGHVLPDSHAGGEITECVFEYGTATGRLGEYLYSNQVPCEQAVPFPAGGEVSAKINGLSPSTDYHFRLVAKDPGKDPYIAGKTYGAGETLITLGPAGIEGEEATAYVKTALLRAKVDPYGTAVTSCEVQYVAEASFNASGYAKPETAPCVPATLKSGFDPTSVTAPLTNLSVATTYHYRFVVKNGSKTETADGADGTFPTFGIKSFSVEDLGPGGHEGRLTTGGNGKNGEEYTRYVGPSDTQAGSHPYALVMTFKLSLTKPAVRSKLYEDEEAGANLKDTITELPPGLVGNSTVLPRCTISALEADLCNPEARVGKLTVFGPGYLTGIGEEPLYNLVPPAGTPVELGMNVLKGAALVFIKATVRPGGDYGVTAEVTNATTKDDVTGAVVEILGTPDGKPFLTNPTSCEGPLTAKLRIDPWQAPGEFVEDTATLPAITGCGALSFDPSISVLPDANEADSPSGVAVELHVPQNESSAGLMTPSLRNAVVTLPEGMTLNPSSANGLAACSESQFGLHAAHAAECPGASRVGTVEIETPLLFHLMRGSVYLAEENNNPFHSTFALYIEAHGEGAAVKVAGKVEPNPVTGQLVSSFEETPELQFSDFRLHFFGGSLAPLATPKVCGTYTSKAVMTPWSAPESGTPAEPTIPFEITKGPGGAPCATPGFSPSFTAGTTSVQAGGFTPFTLTMGRGDGEQNLGTIKTALPPGVTGVLTGIPLCPEPQASRGECSAASQIGHVLTGVGAGPFPLFVPGPGTAEDPVYLTGSYKGAPFGLSVVVPAEAGPFNLDENGLPVVVRAKVEINPVTSQVTVESDPLPQMLKGVPLDIRDVNVVIDRPNFLLNSTNCERMQIEATLTSAGGIVANRSVPFQATNCARLGFSPEFSVSTPGKPSRTDGVGLDVKLNYPQNSLGKDANIAKVKVELPKQLPSRLTTLQKACTDAVFDQNPNNCPAASRVGEATATTPILPVPLSGPAYFVSHGGAKFPELIIVLSGYGITVDLHGETFINKEGITSSTFPTIPDVPIGSFELKLPAGPDSALAGNGNLCTSKLVMPTYFTAQDGVTLEQQTPITVQGCKPSILVVGHNVKGSHASIRITVPSAGTLVASGGSIQRSSMRVAKAGTVTVAVTLDRHSQRVLAKNPHQRLNAKVQLRLTPQHGAPLTAHVRLLMG